MIDTIVVVCLLFLVFDAAVNLRRFFTRDTLSYRSTQRALRDNIPPLHYNCRCTIAVVDDPYVEITDEQRANIKAWFDTYSIRWNQSPYEPPLVRAQHELARIYGCEPSIAFDVAEQLRNCK